MVPTSIILIVLVIGFAPAATAYLLGWPKRRLVNPYFAVLATSGSLMLLALILDVLDIPHAWLSWVLLLAGFVLIGVSMRMLRMAREVVRQRDQEIAERRARGG